MRQITARFDFNENIWNPYSINDICDELIMEDAIVSLSDGVGYVIIDETKLLHDFIDWYNEHHPESYIPNSRLGNYLQEKSVSSSDFLSSI